MLRSLLGLAVLGLIAAVVAWNVQNLETKAPLIAAPTAQAPRYIVKNAQWTHLDAQGVAEFHMTADHLYSFDDRSAQLENIILDRFVAGRSPWRMTSPKGVIPPHEDRVQLLDPVVVEGVLSNGAPVKVTTPELWMDSKRNEFYTDALVNMSTPQWQAHGTGLRADMGGEKLALLHNTQVTYVAAP